MITYPQNAQKSTKKTQQRTAAWLLWAIISSGEVTVAVVVAVADTVTMVVVDVLVPCGGNDTTASDGYTGIVGKLSVAVSTGMAIAIAVGSDSMSMCISSCTSSMPRRYS